MLLLNINRKPCMGSPMVPSHLTLSDLERSKSRSLRFQSLIFWKGAELGPMLLLTINRKPYMGSPMAPSHFNLEWPWKVKVKVTKILSSSRSVWYTYICLRLITTLIWISQKGLCWRRDFPSQRSFLLGYTVHSNEFKYYHCEEFQPFQHVQPAAFWHQFSLPPTGTG